MIFVSYQFCNNPLNGFLFCCCFQSAPHHFPCEVTTVMESKLNTDLLFPGASAVIVSCQQDPKTARKE